MKKTSIYVDERMEEIIALLKSKPEGMLGKEISKITGFSARQTSRLLIGLRAKGRIYSTVIDDKKKINLWAISPVEIGETTVPPYPDLDDEFNEWLKKARKKTIYNPWPRN